MLKTLHAGLTNVGKVRTSNEDSMGLFPDQNLYSVADGMGGHAAGEVASKLAVETLTEAFSKSEGSENSHDPAQRLEMAIKEANHKIYGAGKQTPDLAGMGTTIVSTYMDQETAYIGHVGDSRAYLVRLNQISQLTKDHSLVNEYLNRGMMSPEEAEHHPLKHVLSRALGTSAQVEVDILVLPVKPGDILLLCSDGLSNTVPSETFLKILQNLNGKLQEACSELVEQANSHGGIDNITVVLLQCLNNNS